MLTPPKNDLSWINMQSLLRHFSAFCLNPQKDFDIYDGGPNIFMDGPMTYIINKSGPNNLDLKDGD